MLSFAIDGAVKEARGNQAVERLKLLPLDDRLSYLDHTYDIALVCSGYLCSTARSLLSRAVCIAGPNALPNLRVQSAATVLERVLPALIAGAVGLEIVEELI